MKIQYHLKKSICVLISVSFCMVNLPVKTFAIESVKGNLINESGNINLQIPENKLLLDQTLSLIPKREDIIIVGLNRFTNGELINSFRNDDLNVHLEDYLLSLNFDIEYSQYNLTVIDLLNRRAIIPFSVTSQPQTSVVVSQILLEALKQNQENRDIDLRGLVSALRSNRSISNFTYEPENCEGYIGIECFQCIWRNVVAYCEEYPGDDCKIIMIFAIVVIIFSILTGDQLCIS